MNADPHQQPTPESTALEGCPLCAAPTTAADRRCRACGYLLTVARGGNPFASGSLWILALVLAVTYAVTVLLLLAAR